MCSDVGLAGATCRAPCTCANLRSHTALLRAGCHGECHNACSIVHLWWVAALAANNRVLLDGLGTLPCSGIASPRPATANAGTQNSSSGSSSNGSSSSGSSRSTAPRVPEEALFPVILGTDILYEWPMVDMVACVPSASTGWRPAAVLCCAAPCVSRQVMRRC